MGGMPAHLTPDAQSGLAALSPVYEERDGRFFFAGTRPKEGRWHKHGTTQKKLRTVVNGQLQTIILAKQRWKNIKTGETRHSRPPDDHRRARFCTLAVAMALWAWLTSEKGVHTHVPAFEEPSPRTLQRWMRRARAVALETQQALRSAVFQRSEPQPEMNNDAVTSTGPPHKWRSHRAVVWSHRTGLALLQSCECINKTDAALLMSEAHGRCCRGEILL